MNPNHEGSATLPEPVDGDAASNDVDLVDAKPDEADPVDSDWLDDEPSAGPIARRAPVIAAGLLSIAALVGANLLGDWYQAGQAAVVPEDTDDRSPAQPVHQSPSPSPSPSRTPSGPVPTVPPAQPEAPPEDSSGGYVPSIPVAPVPPAAPPPAAPPPAEPPQVEPPEVEPPEVEPPEVEPPEVEPPQAEP